MAHSIDQAAVVKGILVQDSFQISTQRVLVLPVRHMLLDIFKHFNNFQVCPAVSRSFQGTEGRCNGGIGICTGRRNHMVGKRRVVSAAVIRMEDQRHIQHLRFQLCVNSIRMKHLQNVLRHGQLRLRIPDKQASNFYMCL